MTDSLDQQGLERLKAGYRLLERHLVEEHGVHATGSASRLEAAHQVAHRREGTRWHLRDWAAEAAAREEG